MIKKLLLLFIAIFILTSFKPNRNKNDVQGKIVWVGKHCDFYIVETSSFFVLIQDYSNKYYDVGDIIEGDLESYNYKTVKNLTKDSEMYVWVENYWSHIDTCYQWLSDHNKCKD